MTGAHSGAWLRGAAEAGLRRQLAVSAPHPHRTPGGEGQAAGTQRPGPRGRRAGARPQSAGMRPSLPPGLASFMPLAFARHLVASVLLPSPLFPFPVPSFLPLPGRDRAQLKQNPAWEPTLTRKDPRRAAPRGPAHSRLTSALASGDAHFLPTEGAAVGAVALPFPPEEGGRPGLWSGRAPPSGEIVSLVLKVGCGRRAQHPRCSNHTLQIRLPRTRDLSRIPGECPSSSNPHSREPCPIHNLLKLLAWVAVFAPTGFPRFGRLGRPILS